MDSAPLLVIVGETASGKSAIAMNLAEKFNGELIAGDARTIYRGMDIGTAKPSYEDRKRVPHHLIDEIDPDTPITAALFKDKALQAIQEIVGRGKLPILVGGSGLYIDSVLFDFSFNLPAEHKERSRLQTLSVPELQDELTSRDIQLPENSLNPRHLIRSIETAGGAASKSRLRANTLVLGTTIQREDLRDNISKRVDAMLAQGLEKEVRGLVKRYGWNDQIMQTIGYKELKKYFDGQETIEEVRGTIIKNTLAYAKRQRTWFKRNPSIIYPCNEDEFVELTTTWLNKSK